MADAVALLVGDIDRGGRVCWLLGNWISAGAEGNESAFEDLRIKKFRGDCKFAWSQGYG